MKANVYKKKPKESLQKALRARMVFYSIEPKPSKLNGLARLFDIGNTLTDIKIYNTRKMNDRNSIEITWRKVGSYLSDAIKKYGKTASR